MVEGGPRRGAVDHFSIAEDPADFNLQNARASSSRGMQLQDLSMELESTMLSSRMLNHEKFSSSFGSDPGDDPDDFGFSRMQPVGGDHGDEQAVFSSFSNVIQPPSSSKAETSTPTRYPCKARNVAPDHNNDTAYLELPANPCHGHQLYCSHRECKESGRAFRWCDVCQIVVAKRNFMKRHSHGLMAPTKSTSTKKPAVRSNKKAALAVRKPTVNNYSVSIPNGPNATLAPLHPQTEEHYLRKAQAVCGSTNNAVTVTSSLSEALTGETVAGLAREGGIGSFATNDGQISFETTGFLNQALELSNGAGGRLPSNRAIRIFTEDEDASIAEIGSLQGWDYEADIDMIFD